MSQQTLLIFSFILFVLSSIQCSTTENYIIQLNDSNFEHLTQATTGATTGAWFIEFYAPWCGYCQQFQPKWSELSVQLHSLNAPVSIGTIDGTVNNNLLQRFNIQQYPTLIYINNGKQYNVNNLEQSVDEYIDFVLYGYHTSSGQPVAPIISSASSIQHAMIQLLVEIRGLLISKPMAVSLIFNSGLFLGVAFNSIIQRLVQTHVRQKKLQA